MFAIFSSLINANGQSTEPKTGKEVKKWFKKKEWLDSLQLKPHKSVNVEEFAKQYWRNKKYWEEAFSFLRDHDLQKMAVGKYPIDGTNVFASVTENATKSFDPSGWESHRKYIDLQYVITEEEKIGVCPVSQATVTNAYEDKRDAANYTARGKIYEAVPGTFFIFFPGDAHQSNITTGGNNIDKKIVIKIRVSE